MNKIPFVAVLLSLVACGGTAESEAEEQDLRRVKFPFVECTLYDNTADWEYRAFYFAKTTTKELYKVETTIRSKPAEIHVEADKKGLLQMGFTAIGNSKLDVDAPADGSWAYKDEQYNDFHEGNRDFALVCNEISMDLMRGYRRLPMLVEPVRE